MNSIAVAFAHGVEIDAPGFAARPAAMLRAAFARAAGMSRTDADDALIVEAVTWAPHIEQRQRELFARMYSEEGARTFFDGQLERLVKRLDAGRAGALVPLAGWLLLPFLPGIPGLRGLRGSRGLRYPGARWLLLHFGGDIIAYDRQRNEANYVAAHESLARALARLAEKAGDAAPLCVLAHSFGSVLVSDYVYDQQETLRGRKLVPDRVRAAMGTSALARGETLAWLYTMGSPLALWSLRYPDATLDRPLDFPGPDIAGRRTALQSEWVNFHDPDDVAAYPLRPLGPAYEQQVTMDGAIEVRGPWPPFQTPLVHPFYWTDGTLMEAVGRSLAKGWRHLNP
ncbi:hypothetical protein HCN51_55500 [Nonomuraea sp. FMUSA5-5]|uniref:Alpha/beta hydrolase n=1 Tax=Nonomuraea composti TaxID=2720023 RepID=A0ABX1BLB4_9ACTN|nr:hypothetical protein [Nonomuraea sp. FMUSA5-5]NJP98535.1 hypothetical protein [Nonomuraea sp. FMUSA5-5]